MEEQIGYLITMFQRRLAATPMAFFRYLYKIIDWNDSMIGIKGPKGCGTSTLLLQHIKETFKGKELDKVLYVSLDNLWFSTHDIIDVIDYIIRMAEPICLLMRFIITKSGKHSLRTLAMTTLDFMWSIQGLRCYSWEKAKETSHVA